ncbi:MAG: helix-turn-helix domain-containing protein [Spirochaetaceae bacterium]|jgi:DNA-binding LacI/PurR family transcriptional regulator/AraC-like DNA-binding protein|nr:helix-turn-helix domain-containing protein [Spirochaetaceae bacterium]
MGSAKKRIGLMLASIHTGASQNVWSSFAKIAKTEGAALFIFPGGRLNAGTDSEYLRNSVYSLANLENLDGLISWSSSIRYTESAEEFEDFHKGFDPLPYVTLAYKVPGHPCVQFDAYNGMKSLAAHFITVHHARRIAFLQGPTFHQSAASRLRGYRDALKEGGLPFDPDLVTEPFNWNCGGEAAAQLYEKRGYTPGRDFDTLIGSSDMMVFSAAHYFRKKGWHIPLDYHAGGFNNSGESRILESPLSTVHMPYAELSSESFRIMLKLLSGKKKRGIEDVSLPSEVIIRESCGCLAAHTEMKPSGQRLSPEESVNRLLEMAAESSAFYSVRLNPAAMRALASPIIRAFFYEPKERFFQVFEKGLSRFFTAGYDPETLISLLERMFASGLMPEDKILRASSVYGAVFRMQERLGAQARYAAEKGNSILNSLKCELLGTRDRKALVQSLARYLPAIGITAGGIALFEDEKISVWIGGFSPEGIMPGKEQRFPAKLLTPENLKNRFADGIFMVQPLFIENQSLGYFIHNAPFREGLIFEELRSAISYALKGIALMEEMIRTKQIAEQAERGKTEFLLMLENEIYDPLAGMLEKVECLEKRLPVSPEDLQDIKAFIAARNAEAGNLIDLRLSKTGDLSIHKRLFDPDELLPGIGYFPLLTGDVSRLSQCFSIIRDVYAGGVSASLRREGLRFLISKTREEKKETEKEKKEEQEKEKEDCKKDEEKKEEERQEADAKKETDLKKEADVKEETDIKKEADAKKKKIKKSLLLAERIVLLHGGSCFWGDAYCTVTLPWTTLTGAEPARCTGSPRDHILSLSDPSLMPANFFALKAVRDVELAAALPGRMAYIFWDAGAASTEDLVRISALRRRAELLTVPFLCYRRDSSFAGRTLTDALERAITSPPRGVVLFVNVSESLRRVWLEDQIEGITIASMDVFNETVSEIVPALIVLNGVNTDAVEQIRRHPLTAAVPVVMASGRIQSPAEVLSVSRYSRTLLCHSSVAVSSEFRDRVRALIGGDETLPPHTGALVKKTLLYFDGHAEFHISRWKLAESVHVSEDYLTRIFHREMGLSLWDYLNRYRVFYAADLLRQTDDTIQEIALRSGFQDQAYFCRVFKKIYGTPPGKLRKR